MQAAIPLAVVVSGVKADRCCFPIPASDRHISVKIRIVDPWPTAARVARIEASRGGED